MWAMIVERIRPNIIHFRFPTRYHVCSACIRIQEFYESPYDKIRNHYFTMDDYMDHYAEVNYGEFTYFNDWDGFNIPGDSIINFWKVFNEHERPIRRKEGDIFASLMNFITTNNSQFYIIGTHDDAQEAITHEIAHAYYYLSDDYKKSCQTIYDEMPKSLKNKLHEEFAHIGYVDNVFADEVQAYFATDDVASITARFRLTYDVSEWVDRYRDAFVTNTGYDI